MRKDGQCNFIAFCSSALRIKLLTKFLKLLLQLSNVIFLVSEIPLLLKFAHMKPQCLTKHFSDLHLQFYKQWTQKQFFIIIIDNKANFDKVDFGLYFYFLLVLFQAYCMLQEVESAKKNLWNCQLYIYKFWAIFKMLKHVGYMHFAIPIINALTRP